MPWAQAPHPDPASGSACARSCSAGGLGVSIGFAFTVALMFSLVLMISFLELLARVTGVALSLLVVFITVQRISAHELPGWLPCCKQGGVIEVGAATRGLATLRLWVRETGVGLDPRAECGTGLANLRARLGAMYGAAASLQFTAVAPHEVHAELHIPAEVHLRGRSDKLPVSRS